MSEPNEKHFDSEEIFGCPYCGFKPPFHHSSCPKRKKVNQTEKPLIQESLQEYPHEYHPEYPHEMGGLEEVPGVEEIMKKRETTTKPKPEKKEEKILKAMDKIANPEIKKMVTNWVMRIKEDIIFSIKPGIDIETLLTSGYFLSLFSEIKNHLSRITEPNLKKLMIEALKEEIEFTQIDIKGISHQKLIEINEKIQAAIDKYCR